ncbi:hypothetical protein [Chryseobacterium rhizosphaerae]|uniref:hypothetical protein n=1 Tax=Chryseobacterium rhizosphaerae TaxID=395937 RepID=UPI0023597A8E|nr:hypothetical protein [Chryseobacterium rhizosphaerae]MDC8098437.1 hypothetical protein [Chryseobacterium rhizosphaerae]
MTKRKITHLYDGLEVKREVNVHVKSNEGFEKTYIDDELALINFHELAEILQKRIEDYTHRKKRLVENIDDYSNYVDNVEMFDDRYIDGFTSEKETSDSYLIKYHQYYKIKDFFEAKEIIFFEDISYIVSFNRIMYKNFEYSIPKIFNFFNDKISRKNSIPEYKQEERIIPVPLPETKHNKIPINGSTQLIGYIFSELISKGYIILEKRNGNINTPFYNVL